MAVRMPQGVRGMIRPRNGGDDGYPFDLDASERFTRPPTGYAVYWDMPKPGERNGVGLMSSFLSLFTGVSWSQRYAATPFGPDVGSQFVNLGSQTIVPGFNKTEGWE